MPATLTVRVRTGAPAGSLSAAVTGIDWISADNNTNSLANRTTNPISIPGSGDAYSFEKWCTLSIDVIPANYVTNFQFWTTQGGSGGAGSGVTILSEGAITSYTQPSSTGRSTASPAPTASGSSIAWDLSTLSSLSALTKYLVLQLRVNTSATQGNIGQATLSYSYDEA